MTGGDTSNWRIAIILFLIPTCIGLAWGIPSLQIYLKSREEAQVIDINQLCSKGPGDNLHVTIKDLQFGKFFKAYENKQEKRWGMVILPAFPLGSIEPGRSPMVLVRTYEIDQESKLKQYIQRTSVSGILVNGIEDCRPEQNEIGEKYGRTNNLTIPVLDCTKSVPAPGVLALVWALVAICGPLTLFALAKCVKGNIDYQTAIPDLSPEPTPSQCRARGVVSIIFALLLAKFCLIDILSAAEHHVDYIWWYSIFAGLFPGGMVLGLYSVVAGKSFQAQFRSKDGLISKTGAALELAIVAIPGIALLIWMYARLHELGYYSTHVF